MLGFAFCSVNRVNGIFYRRIICIKAAIKSRCPCDGCIDSCVISGDVIVIPHKSWMTDSGNPFNTRTGIGLQASKDICGGELGDSSATRRLVKGRVGTRSTCIPINHQLSNGKVIAFIIRIFFFIKRYTIRRGIRPNAVGNMGLYNSCNPSDIARLSASDVFCCNYAIFDYYARLVPREVFKVCTENTTYS